MSCVRAKKYEIPFSQLLCRWFTGGFLFVRTVTGFKRCVEVCPEGTLATWSNSADSTNGEHPSIALMLHRLLLAKGAANARSTSKYVVRRLYACMQHDLVTGGVKNEMLKLVEKSPGGVSTRDLDKLFVPQRLSARKKVKGRRQKPWAMKLRSVKSNLT